MNKTNSDKEGKWVWGIFYFNKYDDGIFPPKRNPIMGLTINFANWKSILAFLALLAFFGAIIWFIEY